MELLHPIDAEIRAWLKTHVDNHSELSLAIGRSDTWLHKYVNGSGKATIDDLVRIGGLLMGLNLPRLTETEQKVLKVLQSLKPQDQQDVMAYAEHRAKLARQQLSKEPSALEGHILPATERKELDRRRVGAETDDPNSTSQATLRKRNGRAVKSGKRSL
jgi:hypothetical protein